MRRTKPNVHRNVGGKIGQGFDAALHREKMPLSVRKRWTIWIRGIGRRSEKIAIDAACGFAVAAFGGTVRVRQPRYLLVMADRPTKSVWGIDPCKKP